MHLGVERRESDSSITFGLTLLWTAFNSISVLRAHFLYEILVPKNFKPKTQLCNYWRQNFVQKMRALNVDEIDTWSKKVTRHEWTTKKRSGFRCCKPNLKLTIN